MEHINENPLLYEIEKYRHTTLTENTSKRIMGTWRRQYETLYLQSNCNNVEEFMEVEPIAEDLVRRISKDMDIKKEWYLIG
tara:strand:+ start:538 stop:780 length:243 start_codon:yes stop_codon:yes gene_type:complete